MKLPRRKFLRLAAGAVALPAASRGVWAQAYPSRPVRIVVAVAAGGSSDILARMIGQWLSARFRQPFVVANKPGGGGNVGTETVVRAPADGHTLLLVAPSNAINATLYDNLGFNFIRDIAPVASIMRAPNVMVVHPSVPATSVNEFIVYAKANPGKVNFASSGNGTSPHIAGELFKMMTGIGMVHVPYRSAGPAVTDLLGGQVQVMFATAPSAIEYVQAGRLRALGVTTAVRFDALPEVPAVNESVPGYEASGWNGLGAPRNTPLDIISSLNSAVNEALADSKIRARLALLGGAPLPGSSAEFGRLIADETEKWGKVVRAAKLKVD